MLPSSFAAPSGRGSEPTAAKIALCAQKARIPVFGALKARKRAISALRRGKAPSVLCSWLKTPWTVAAVLRIRVTQIGSYGFTVMLLSVPVSVGMTWSATVSDWLAPTLCNVAVKTCRPWSVAVKV
jgi:hypothetical protein